MTRVHVVIPTYNELDNLVPLLTRARAALATCSPPPRVRFLIVDDASPDGTGLLADDLARRHDDVDVLHRSAKDGIATAYIAGFARALGGGADLVVQMDADLSHDPADLPRLVAAARDGADLALGSRYVPGGRTVGWSPWRKALSRSGGVYAAFVLGLPVRDPTGGFKCFRAEALRALDLTTVACRGYAFQVEVTHQATRRGFEIAELPITFREREHGHSKMSAAIAAEALWRIPGMRVRTSIGGQRAAASVERSA
jgi:dolichol-phosphate mannosyltransferase